MNTKTSVNPRALRLALGLGREGFAHRMGVTLNTVFRWEHGLCVPNKYAAAKLRHLARDLAERGETRSE